MTAPLPPTLDAEHETAWNAIARAWDQFSGSNASDWPEKRRQFCNGLRAQMTLERQPESFIRAAQTAIRMIETHNSVFETQ